MYRISSQLLLRLGSALLRLLVCLYVHRLLVNQVSCRTPAAAAKALIKNANSKAYNRKHHVSMTVSIEPIALEFTY